MNLKFRNRFLIVCLASAVMATWCNYNSHIAKSILGLAETKTLLVSAQTEKNHEINSLKSFCTSGSMEIPDDLKKISRIEPSGILWNESIQKYLLISDNTGWKNQPNDKMPWLFLMDSTGKIDSKPISISGLDSVNDLEAVTQDQNGKIYLISSQNISKTGKRPVSRERIIKAHWNGDHLILDQYVNFLTLLFESYTEQELYALGLEQLECDGKPVLNIEGAAWQDNALYLGLKEPKEAKGAIIWKLDDPASIFLNKKLMPNQLTMYGNVKFEIHNGRQSGISDLTFDAQGRLWALTTIPDIEDNNQKGGLYRIDRFHDSQLKATCIAEFPNLKPEGLSFEDNENFMIVFNNGEDTPEFYSGKI